MIRNGSKIGTSVWHGVYGFGTVVDVRKNSYIIYLKHKPAKALPEFILSKKNDISWVNHGNKVDNYIVSPRDKEVFVPMSQFMIQNYNELMEA